MEFTLPDIRIQYAWLLAGVTADALNGIHGDGRPLGEYDQLTGIANTYEDWWRPFNDDVLTGICDITGLQFKQNIIDVYVSPWFTPISNPMVLGPAFTSQDELVNVLTHELIHRLLTDNTSRNNDENLITKWEATFGTQHERRMLVHIPVHAIMQKLYIDVLKRPDLYEMDVQLTKSNKPYADAWRYVRAEGYEAIIKSL